MSEPCGCGWDVSVGGCGGVTVTIPEGAVPHLPISGERTTAIVSAAAQVCKGEFVRRVLEYAPVGEAMRWAVEDAKILAAAELSQGRVGVVFTQRGKTKFKLIALVGGEIQLGNTLVLVEDEEITSAVLLEVERDKALVAYPQDAAGMAAVITLKDRAATLAYTDLWDSDDPENLCGCVLAGGTVLLGCMRQSVEHANEGWVRSLEVAADKLSLRGQVRVDGNTDTDVYAGAWTMAAVTPTTAVLVYPQLGGNQPVGFAVLDVDPTVYNAPIAVRLIGAGKYASALPTIEAVDIGQGRWLVAYGVGWLSSDKSVVKSTLAIEVWGLTRYAAELIWYGCEDTRFKAALGGVQVAPTGAGAAITYTGDQSALGVFLGLLEGPDAGPGVPLGAHNGFCRVVPISPTKAIQVTQRAGSGYAQLLELAERVFPDGQMVTGIALTGGGPGQEITVQGPTPK